MSEFQFWQYFSYTYRDSIHIYIHLLWNEKVHLCERMYRIFQESFYLFPLCPGPLSFVKIELPDKKKKDARNTLSGTGTLGTCGDRGGCREHAVRGRDDGNTRQHWEHSRESGFPSEAWLALLVPGVIIPKFKCEKEDPEMFIAWNVIHSLRSLYVVIF